ALSGTTLRIRKSVMSNYRYLKEEQGPKKDFFSCFEHKSYELGLEDGCLHTCCIQTPVTRLTLWDCTSACCLATLAQEGKMKTAVVDQYQRIHSQPAEK
ncbi:hypothetical protein, partial [Candidatus Electrothrix sp.]|uniref:hypothetical protein n=1 Tax=Candidatus Electrothrix sp. TaxID=2170559 RepID=UPI004057AA1B